MKRINEAISEKYPGFTKGQRLLASFVTEYCDKAAFMSSFELASVSGVSQSTVIRFAAALGYNGYTEFQEALQTELKYRLSTLSRFELMSDDPDDNDVFEGIAATDALNIKKNVDLNPVDAVKNLCMRLSFSSKVYIYGQDYASAAAQYLSYYLRILLQNVCNINNAGIEPLSAISDIESGDLLLIISFPVHSDNTRRLAAYARHRDACVVTISEGTRSEIANYADINLVSEYGDYGVNGTLAPLISLCGSIISLLVRNDEKAQARLRLTDEAAGFVLQEE
ncbi:MAG: MurR/RpiR family transcriptional regulator [Ruminococcaceae bacterium]|jgi:DNA-binding MurR/RpiR family transcriptional regulator|nr:MurR/RpiR family transcriptional regulator [Oscillospiraceae bacterium]